jgi:hypothetical protein
MNQVAILLQFIFGNLYQQYKKHIESIKIHAMVVTDHVLNFNGLRFVSCMIQGDITGQTAIWRAVFGQHNKI